jgi:hypothetical protein
LGFQDDLLPSSSKQTSLAITAVPEPSTLVLLGIGGALACWAAAELCRQLATQKGHERDATISAVSSNGQTQSSDLARRAKDWFAQYRIALGLPDPEAAAGGNAAGTVVSFERTRTRARFSTLGY